LFFLHIGDPDHVGHFSGWMSEAYMEAVRAADEYVGEIMDKLESMGHLGATTVIILSDHGGLEFDHGDPVPEVLLIPAESMDARSEEG